MNNFIVYGHYATGSETPFYIGIGSNKRAYDKKQRTKYWKSHALKHGLEVRILYRGLTWTQAVEREVALIKKYGRKRYDKGGVLVNLSLGGDGSPGVFPNEETRKKLREAAKRSYPLRREATIRANKGKKRSPEQRERISNALKGKIKSETHCERISISKKGKKMSEDFKAKCRVRMAGEGNPMFGKSRPEVGERNKEIKRIEVMQFDKELNLIKTHPSIAQAAIETGCDESAIIRVCNGKQKTSLGYVWRKKGNSERLL
jgi:hypothetical protein